MIEKPDTCDCSKCFPDTDPEPVLCLCGNPVPEDSHWFYDRVSGIKFCSDTCAKKYGDMNENGEEIP